jgi:hypothetical protein
LLPTVLALSLYAGATLPPAEPATAIQSATADARALGQEARHARYLWLGHLSEAERADLARVLSFHANQLSREAEVIVPVEASPGLFRVDLRWYGWPATLWERLADSEPYFTETVTEEVQEKERSYWAGGYEGGTYYEPGYYVTKTTRVRVSRGPAAWLSESRAGARAVRDLTALTGSQVPVVRGDWFLWTTSLQADRGRTGYYEWLGIRDQQDFEALVGFSRRAARTSPRKELLEAVPVSAVALEPRRVGAFPAQGGYLWRAFYNRRAEGERNPLRVLDDGFRFIASQDVGHLPNGLPCWGIFTADGARLDAASADTASDFTAPGADKRLHVALSCIRCHMPHDGFRPIAGWTRSLYANGSGLALTSPDHGRLQRLRRQYLGDLEGALEDSRRVTTRAVGQATGLRPTELAKLYAAAWAAYDAPVTVERAARDAGMSADEFQAALRRRLASAGELDTVLAGLLAGKAIPVQQWHEVHPLVQQALYE